MTDTKTVSSSLTPEGIAKLERLKAELEALQTAMENTKNMNQYEIEGRMRAFQDKENEIKLYLRNLGLMPQE